MSKNNTSPKQQIMQQIMNYNYVPPETTSHSTSKSYDNYFTNQTVPESQCPRCRTEWHIAESPIFGKKEIWYDCIKCNLTREEIEKKTV